ncbi:hypothetical protein [Calothrix sp. PCC 6303]|uniref:hypothetical protein n=1 Tax=Calothrix sp. PCC 6303 TaxID=1170562 RepID=UPI001181A193|nr:hypothetical protein [Calothrix sp. PCC 6303]
MIIILFEVIVNTCEAICPTNSLYCDVLLLLIGVKWVMRSRNPFNISSNYSNFNVFESHINTQILCRRSTRTSLHSFSLDVLFNPK